MRKLKIDTILFIAIISLLGIVNFLNFNKPTVSRLENRALKQKPTFSPESLFTGSYLREFEEYYSDTFILRDSLVKASRDFRQAAEFLGPDVSLVTAYEDIQLPGKIVDGAVNANGDEAGGRPTAKADNEHERGEGGDMEYGTDDEPMDATGNDTEYGTVDEPMDATGNDTEYGTGREPTGVTGGTGDGISGGAGNKTGSNDENSPAGSSTPETGEKSNKDFGDGPDVGYWLVVDGKAVQLFKFNKENFDYYSKVLNKYSEKLGSSVKIYSMIPPTNSEFVQLKRYKGITDSQNDALGFLESRLGGSISSVNVYDSLNEHKDEYIYFRTDHHWTALGAYYAYEAFMKTRGDVPVPLDRYEKLDLGDFLGSTYTKTLNKSLKKNPDNIIAYKPFTKNEYLMYDGKKEIKADVIDMGYAADITKKYLAFLSTGGGTWSVIKTDVNNGKKILVIKDSFGNALVPFLLPHYEEIYVVDSRFYSISAAGKNIEEFIEEKGISEVLFVIYMEDVNWHKFMSGVENLLGE